MRKSLERKKNRILSTYELGARALKVKKVKNAKVAFVIA